MSRAGVYQERGSGARFRVVAHSNQPILRYKLYLIFYRFGMPNRDLDLESDGRSTTYHLCGYGITRGASATRKSFAKDLL